MANFQALNVTYFYCSSSLGICGLMSTRWGGLVMSISVTIMSKELVYNPVKRRKKNLISNANWNLIETKIIIYFDIFVGRCWKILKSGRVLVLEGSLIFFFKLIIKLKKSSFLMQRYHRWLQLSAFSGVRWNRHYGIIKKQAVKLAGVAGYTKQILYFENRYRRKKELNLWPPFKTI